MATDNRALIISAHQKVFSLEAQLPYETVQACRELIYRHIRKEVSWSTTKKQLQTLVAHAQSSRRGKT